MLRLKNLRKSFGAITAVACLVATVSISVLLLLFGVLVFKVRAHSYPLLALALVSSGLCFVGIMMFLSVLGKTENSAANIGWAVLMLMAMTGGGMMPLFMMPSWMRSVSHLSPCKWAILTFEGAIWRGFTLSEMLLPCAILIAVGVVFFAVGAKVFRWTEA